MAKTIGNKDDYVPLAGTRPLLPRRGRERSQHHQQHHDCIFHEEKKRTTLRDEVTRIANARKVRHPETFIE
jgi:hypothetical protein